MAKFARSRFINAIIFIMIFAPLSVYVVVARASVPEKSHTVNTTSAVQTPTKTGLDMKDMIQIGLFLISVISGIGYVANRQGAMQGCVNELKTDISQLEANLKEAREARYNIRVELNCIRERLIVIETTNINKTND